MGFGLLFVEAGDVGQVFFQRVVHHYAQLVNANVLVVNGLVKILFSAADLRTMREDSCVGFGSLEQPHHDHATVAAERQADWEVRRAPVVANDLDRRHSRTQ